jgi:hypothetical protein
MRIHKAVLALLTGLSVAHGLYDRVGNGPSASTAFYRVACSSGSSKCVAVGLMTSNATSGLAPSKTAVEVGSQDALVAGYDIGAGRLDYLKAIGSSGGESANDVAMDSAGNAYVAGGTSGSVLGMPVQGASGNGFLVKLNSESERCHTPLCPLASGCAPTCTHTSIRAPYGEHGQRCVANLWPDCRPMRTRTQAPGTPCTSCRRAARAFR